MTEEHTTNDSAEPKESKATRSYERSTIEFPYNDLDEALSVAKAIHANAGVGCTLDQLAAYMKQSMTSGAFRGRVASAGTFRLTENERGEVRLTELGRQIVDPAREANARAEAFLSVPLYARVFDNYKGYTLPPAAALERFMKECGVGSKQTDKARQAFMRSARQAAFFAHGEDRLVKPITADAGPGTKPIDQRSTGAGQGAGNGTGVGGGGQRGSGGGDPPHPDPLIAALIQKLPNGGDWDADQRIAWLQLMAMAFQISYGAADAIEIKKVV